MARGDVLSLPVERGREVVDRYVPGIAGYWCECEIKNLLVVMRGGVKGVRNQTDKNKQQNQPSAATKAPRHRTHNKQQKSPKPYTILYRDQSKLFTQIFVRKAQIVEAALRRVRGCCGANGKRDPARSWWRMAGFNLHGLPGCHSLVSHMEASSVSRLAAIPAPHSSRAAMRGPCSSSM